MCEPQTSMKTRGGSHQILEDSRPSCTLKIANEMMKGNKSLVLWLTDWLGIASMHINQNRFCLVLVSPPARGAWIEIDSQTATH